ncbi:hypothetical protein LCGC14_1020490, partial [marine sediment metagenome]
MECGRVPRQLLEKLARFSRKIKIPSLIALPVILSILGARLWNPIPLLVLVVVVCGLVLAVSFKRIDKKYYPWILGSISLSLLWQTTLISNYLIGTDIHTEYYYYNLAFENGWNPNLPHNYNSAVGVTVLAPFLSRLLHIDGVWVFKVIYPLLFAFTPVVLYHAYKRLVAPRKAFLASFFFISVPVFTVGAISISKLQLSALLLALSVLLLIRGKPSKPIGVVFGILLGIGVALFYYTVSYVYIFYILLTVCIVLLIRLIPKLKIPRGVSILGLLAVLIVVISVGFLYFGSVSGGNPMATLTFYTSEHLSVYDPVRGSVTAVEYGYIDPDTHEYIRTRSEEEGLQEAVEKGIGELTPEEIEDLPLDVIIQLELEQLEDLAGETPTPELDGGGVVTAKGDIAPIGARTFLIRTALGLDFFQVGKLGKLFRVIQITTQILIIIGFGVMVWRRKRFPDTYIAIVLVSGLILLACLVKPGFSSLLDITRTYFLTLFALAPLFVIGGYEVFRRIKRRWALPLLTGLVLVPYFLFTSGSIFEVLQLKSVETLLIPYSPALSSPRLDINGIYTDNDVEVVEWIADNIGDNEVYSDLHSMLLAYEYPELH